MRSMMGNLPPFGLDLHTTVAIRWLYLAKYCNAIYHYCFNVLMKFALHRVVEPFLQSYRQ